MIQFMKNTAGWNVGAGRITVAISDGLDPFSKLTLYNETQGD
jgi:hypothetical protein